MVVRVRLRIRRGEKVCEAVAVANSGYEAPTPQLLIPKSTAKELGLWPPPPEAEEATYDTAGGPLRVWYIPRAARVTVVTEDYMPDEVVVDLVISLIADEPLISDTLIEALQIAIEAAARGLWRFTWEPKEKLRQSEKPKRT